LDDDKHKSIFMICDGTFKAAVPPVGLGVGGEADVDIPDVGLFGPVIGSTNPKDGVWDCSSVITKSYPNLKPASDSHTLHWFTPCMQSPDIRYRYY
jgi:hypothetical protein